MTQRQKRGPNPWAPDENPKAVGSMPSVGQTSPYQGGNAHGKHEKKTNSATTAGGDAASQPKQPHGWGSKSPSNRY